MFSQNKLWWGGPPFLKQKEIFTEQDKSESFVDTSEIQNATKMRYQNRHQPKPQVNDIVLVHDNNLPRSMWRLVRTH